MLKIQVSSTRPKQGATSMVALLAHLLATLEIKCDVVPDADGDVAAKMEWMKTDCWDIIKILRTKQVQIVDYSPQTEAIPKVPIVTDAVSRIRQALVAALDYAREMEVANCTDKFEEALALLDQKLSGWQLPEDQLDGGFDLEWMKRVMNVEGFEHWPRCYFNSTTFFDVSTGNVMVHCGPVFEILVQIYDREQFIHFMLGMHLQPFLKHPEMREIVQDEKVVLCGTEIVEAMRPDGTAIRKTMPFGMRADHAYVDQQVLAANKRNEMLPGEEAQQRLDALRSGPPTYCGPLHDIGRCDGASLLPADKHQGHHEASDRRAKMVPTEVPIAEYEARLVPPEKIRDLNQAGEHLHGHPSGIPPLGAPYFGPAKPINPSPLEGLPEYLDPEALMEPEPDLDPVQDGMTRHMLLCGNHEKDAPLLRVLKGYYAKYGDRLRIVKRLPFKLMSYRGFVRRYETLRKIEYMVLPENHFDGDSEEQLPAIPPDMA